MASVEVITGPERRRRGTEEQKRAIVAASLERGAVVAEVARRAEIRPDQIYRWRQHLAPSDGFAQVLIAPPEVPAANAANDAAYTESVIGGRVYRQGARGSRPRSGRSWRRPSSRCWHGE